MGNSEIFTHWISTWKSNVTEWKMSGCFSIQARQLRGLKSVYGEWAKRWIPILTMFGFFVKSFLVRTSYCYSTWAKVGNGNEAKYANSTEFETQTEIWTE